MDDGRTDQEDTAAPAGIYLHIFPRSKLISKQPPPTQLFTAKINGHLSRCMQMN